MRFLQFATVAFVVVTAGVAGAQSTPTTQIAAKLSPESRAAIQQVIDSARAAGLPVAPLSDKMYEGVLKGADDRRIVAAVQRLFHQLSEARDVLGSAKDPVLLGATASALQAGVSPSELRRIVTPVGGTTPDPHVLAGALITVVDLVAKHIAPSTASASIAELVRRRATEQQFTALRGEVEQDIIDGRSPEAALASRTTAYVKVLDATTLPDRPLPRRPPPV
jgi:hypothetical protein